MTQERISLRAVYFQRGLKPVREMIGVTKGLRAVYFQRGLKLVSCSTVVPSV